MMKKKPYTVYIYTKRPYIKMVMRGTSHLHPYKKKLPRERNDFNNGNKPLFIPLVKINEDEVCECVYRKYIFFVFYYCWSAGVYP